MSTSDDAGSWEDVIVGDRMAVDREFQDRVNASSFSNQSWELVMTAIEFEIADPEVPEEAHIVANSDSLGSVLPAMQDIEQSLGQPPSEPSFSDRLVDEVRSLLGSGSDDQERRAEAERLAGEYANMLHTRLQREGKWEQVCERTAGAA